MKKKLASLICMGLIILLLQPSSSFLDVGGILASLGWKSTAQSRLLKKFMITSGNGEAHQRALRSTMAPSTHLGRHRYGIIQVMPPAAPPSSSIALLQAGSPRSMPLWIPG
ncbi:hypothetical protein [Methanothrix sp.]